MEIFTLSSTGSTILSTSFNQDGNRDWPIQINDYLGTFQELVGTFGIDRYYPLFALPLNVLEFIDDEKTRSN